MFQKYLWECRKVDLSPKQLFANYNNGTKEED